MQFLSRVSHRISRFFEIAHEEGFSSAMLAVKRFIVHRTGEIWLLPYLRLRTRRGLVLREIQGSKMYLDTCDPGISRELILYGAHEALATKVVRRVLSSGMTVIDIGANLGYYALLEASLVGEEGQVYALEPVPENFEMLSKNIEVNDYKNVKAYCKAISSKSDVAEMALTHGSNWGSLFDTTAETASDYISQRMRKLTRQTTKVNAVTLDEFLSAEGVNRVNFIRMDIEGYEVEAVKGMINTLRNTPPPIKLFFEIHNKFFDSPESTVGPMLEHLLDLGFEPKLIVLPNMVLEGISRDDFTQTVFSYKSECPHILLEK